MNFEIKKITVDDLKWVGDVFLGWGAEFIVSRGRKIYPTMLEGFYAVDGAGKKVGLVTYEVRERSAEIVTLDAFEKHKGIGTVLLDEVKRELEGKVSRLWLITINDNLDAIRFYQRRGWTFAAIHVNALKHSRKIKPAIPKVGSYGIEMRDEIEMEYLL